MSAVTTIPVRQQKGTTAMRKSRTPLDEPRIAVETITPQVAQAMLDSNTKNRQVSYAVVDKYARDIRAGRFQLNGDTIRFDADGNLIDGQHRLHAVVAADKEIRTYVVRGLAPEVMSTVDCGKVRTLKDHLALNGHVSTSVLTAAINLFNGWEQGTLSAGRTTISHHEADVILAREPGLIDAVRIASGTRRAIGASNAVSAVAWYLMARVDIEATSEFFEQITTGANLQVHDPAFALRRLFINVKGQRSKTLRPEVALAYFIKAWNAYRAGRTVAHLRYQATDAFPELAA